LGAQARVIRGLQGQRQVDFAHQQVLYQLAAMGAGQFAQAVRVKAGPFTDGGRQQGQGQGRCGADAQAVARRPAQVLGQAPYPLQALADLVHFPLQLQGFRGWLQLATHPQEQRETQLQFGVLQNLGHCRLGDMQQLRRAADGAGLADGLENLDMTKAHGAVHNLCLWEVHLYSLSGACHLPLTLGHRPTGQGQS